jgi:hypothetical protein
MLYLCGKIHAIMSKKDDAFDFVLDKIAQNAAQKLRLDPSDPRYVYAIGSILIALSGPDTDDFIAARTMKQLQQAGHTLPEEEVLQLVKQCREKCPRHQFALEKALDDIENYDCSGEEAFEGLSAFLAK